VLPEELPDMIDYTSHRGFVRKVLDREVDYSAEGHRIRPRGQFNDGARSAEYLDHLNRDGSFSGMVAENYVWRPGTELVDRISHQAA
jgi:hypothetical protein